MRILTWSLAALIVGGCTHAAPGSRGVDAVPVALLTAGFPDSVRRDVEILREATRAYHDPAAAEAAGYPVKFTSCAADSSMGGMGYHLLDRPAFDGTLDIRHPEMLVYAPVKNGKPELVAVEFVVPYRVLPRSAKPPTLFGQELKHYDQFNYWEIHVWAWRKNPSGLFADWNPDVKC
jgi:hypothetical protein